MAVSAKHERYRVRAGLLALVGGLLAGELAADSMRCGRALVRTGDSPAALLERCGEPNYRGRGYAEVQTHKGKQRIRVERWHYKRNERSLERIVLVYRGEIVGMETGRR